MLRSRFWAFLWSLWLGGCLWGCQPALPVGQTYLVSVERALSGQTLALSAPIGPDAAVDQIRLAGIQAPDLKQVPWGEAAQQRLQELIGKTVRIEPVSLEPDDYNRLWAYVWRDRQLINQQLVQEGYVLVDPLSLETSPYQTALLRAQEQARLVGLGIWQPKQPLRLTPAEFRQQQSPS